MDAYAPEIERMMKRLYRVTFRRTIDDGTRPSRLPSWVMVGLSTLRGTPRSDPKTIRRGKAELEATDELDTTRVRKKGGVQKGDRDQRCRSKRTS